MSEDRYLLSAGIASDWPYGRGCYVSVLLIPSLNTPHRTPY
jgi:hypothetical protein